MFKLLQKLKMALFLCFSVALLTNCTTTEDLSKLRTQVLTKDRLILPTVDPSLRTCKDRPLKPDLGDNSSQKPVANWASDALDYGDDCKSKLNSVWDILDKAALAAADTNAKAVPMETTDGSQVK